MVFSLIWTILSGANVVHISGIGCIFRVSLAIEPDDHGIHSRLDKELGGPWEGNMRRRLGMQRSHVIRKDDEGLGSIMMQHNNLTLT